MKARQAEVDMICMGSFQALPASNVTNGNLDSVQAELDSVKSELAHFQEVEGRQREKDLRIRKEYDSLDEILKMADLKDGFAEVAREYMNAVGIENIQMIPAIRKR